MHPGGSGSPGRCHEVPKHRRSRALPAAQTLGASPAWICVPSGCVHRRDRTHPGPRRDHRRDRREAEQRNHLEPVGLRVLRHHRSGCHLVRRMRHRAFARRGVHGHRHQLRAEAHRAPRSSGRTPIRASCRDSDAVRRQGVGRHRDEGRHPPGVRLHPANHRGEEPQDAALPDAEPRSGTRLAGAYPGWKRRGCYPDVVPEGAEAPTSDLALARRGAAHLGAAQKTSPAEQCLPQMVQSALPTLPGSRVPRACQPPGRVSPSAPPRARL